MRFLTVISALALLVSPLAAQQGQAGGPRRFGMALEELQEKLQLDSAQKARIQPMVPPMRTMPNSCCASFMLAKAIELVIEIVGT